MIIKDKYLVWIFVVLPILIGSLLQIVKSNIINTTGIVIIIGGIINLMLAISPLPREEKELN